MGSLAVHQSLRAVPSSTALPPAAHFLCGQSLRVSSAHVRRGSPGSTRDSLQCSASLDQSPPKDVAAKVMQAGPRQRGPELCTWQCLGGQGKSLKPTRTGFPSRGCVQCLAWASDSARMGAPSSGNEPLATVHCVNRLGFVPFWRLSARAAHPCGHLWSEEMQLARKAGVGCPLGGSAPQATSFDRVQSPLDPCLAENLPLGAEPLPWNGHYSLSLMPTLDSHFHLRTLSLSSRQHRLQDTTV